MLFGILINSYKGWDSSGAVPLPTLEGMLPGNWCSSFTCWDCRGASAPQRALRSGISPQGHAMKITEAQEIRGGDRPLGMV